MKITYASRSETGNRPGNQDHSGAFVGRNSACFVVCDGVAGTDGGDTAARLASESLLANLSEETTIRPQQTAEWIAASDRAIREQQQKNPNFQQMSTTLAALFIDRKQPLAWWAHAGDSRVYHFRRGQIEQVTRDHSLVQQMCDAGYENTGINSNLLYNALGADGERQATFSEVLPLEDGDVFLLCSDGFWSRISPAEMEQALRMVAAPEEWLALMLNAIRHEARSDNLTAVAVWVGSPQETTLFQSIADSARFLPPRQ